MALLFLSHAGEDSAAACALAQQLRNAGIDVWLDADSLQPGDRWMDALEAAICKAGAFAVYVGRSGVARWVDREVRVALDRNTRDPTFRIIPILGPGSSPESLPTFLRQHHWVSLQSGRAADFGSLVAAVLERPAETVAVLPAGQAPFRGLLAFDVEHALLFFGRDREVEELLSRVGEHRFLAVVGDSGSGKSSLVRAGLIPALLRGRFQEHGSWDQVWRVALFRPGNSPFREAGNAVPDLDPGLAAAQRIEVLEKCRQALEAGADGLYNCVVGLVPPGTRTLLVVDQFEELFTHGATATERHRFIDSLLRAAAGEGERPIHVVLTLRADFYARCWEHPDLPSEIASHQYAVRRMDSARLREAIEGPVRLAGARLEAGLAEAIINEVGSEPGNLPFLEHALLQLWDRRTAEGLLTHTAYADIGRLSGALSRQADQVYERLVEQGHGDVARKIFLRLTQPGEGTEDTRRHARKDELVSLSGATGEAERVLDTLTRERLVTTGENAGTHEGGVDVAHEALIRVWPRLRQWLEENRDQLRIERRLMDAAAEYERGGPDRDEILYRGARLQLVEESVRRQAADLTPTAQRFLAASRDAERRAKLRRRGWSIAFVSTVSVLLLFASGGFFRACHESERAHQALADSEFLQAADVADAAPAVALAHLARSMRLRTSMESALSAAGILVASARFPGTILVHKDQVWSASFSPDGTRVVTASGDRTAQVWDAVTGRRIGRPLEHRQGVRSASFSRDGRLVVTASQDMKGQVWDAWTGLPVGTALGHEKALNSAAFSEDDKWVVTASEDGTARVWDAITGARLQRFEMGDVDVLSASFSHEGALVVTSSDAGIAQVWSTLTGARHGPPLLHERGFGINSASFSRDGRVLTASEDGTARIWSEAAAPVVLKHGNAVTSAVNSASFNKDGTLVVTASRDGTAGLWDARTGVRVATLVHAAEVLSASFSADASEVVTASRDRTARVWRAKDGAALGKPLVHQDEVWSASLSSDAMRVVTASRDKTAQVWDARATALLAEPLVWNRDVYSASLSQDGRRILAACRDNTARVWDATTGQEVEEPFVYDASVNSASWSARGDRVVTASEDGMARVWDPTRKKLIALLEHNGQVWSASFSLDGSRVVTASADGTARIWDARTGKGVRSLPHAGVVLLASFNTDASRVVTTSDDNCARIWDLRTPEAVPAVLVHQDKVNSVSFSPDGSRVLTASADKTARLWTTSTGNAMGRPLVHQEAVNWASFSRDGSWVVTASGQAARLWDARTGRPMGAAFLHPGKVLWAAFDVDGHHVLTACDDRTMRFWDVPRFSSEDAPLLADLIELAGGLRVSELGAVVGVKDRDELLARMRGPSGAARAEGSAVGLFSRWLISDPWTRTISPLSPVTVRRYICDAIRRGAVAEARWAFPGHPLLRYVPGSAAGPVACEQATP